MKPIEIGCRVMVVKVARPEHNSVLGKCGVVVSKVSPGKEKIGDITWNIENYGYVVELDNTHNWKHHQTGAWFKADKVPIRAQSLIRIDGDVDEESKCDEISKITVKSLTFKGLVS